MFSEDILLINCSIATENQLITSIEYVIKKVGERCNYKINFTVNTINYLNKAYVWFSNKKIVYGLTNRNFNGTERNRTEYPLLILPCYKYNKMQLSFLNLVKKSDEILEKGYYEIERVQFKQGVSNINILFSSDLPSWITPEILKKEFSRYITSKQKVLNRNTLKYETFPIVSIFRRNGEDNNSCFIKFNYDGYDGFFCYLMMNKIKLENPVNRQETVKLYFNREDLKATTQNKNFLYRLKY